ncbi:hypothetical protein A2U01_0098624, partial [Trifolium medium]|nr:hypothetical protein [Trifolium medium]
MTNDYYRQHGVSTRLALSNSKRSNQVWMNPDRGKLSTNAWTEMKLKPLTK